MSNDGPHYSEVVYSDASQLNDKLAVNDVTLKDYTTSLEFDCCLPNELVWRYIVMVPVAPLIQPRGVVAVAVLVFKQPLKQRQQSFVTALDVGLLIKDTVFWKNDKDTSVTLDTVALWDHYKFHSIQYLAAPVLVDSEWKYIP